MVILFESVDLHKTFANVCVFLCAKTFRLRFKELEHRLTDYLQAYLGLNVKQIE